MFKQILNSTSLKINLISNLVGNASSAVIGFIFIPFYLSYLGAEAYGLIGIFTTLQVILFLIDSGLSTTLNRELARLNSLLGTALQMRNLVKTLEVVYWLMAILIGTVAVGCVSILANHWVHPKTLSITTIEHCFQLLSISLIFQFPIGFYSGGLLGIQKHLHLNLLKVIFSLLKNGGSLLVLIFYSNTIIVFFEWTLLISCIQVFTFRFAVWGQLPKSEIKAIFDKKELINIWRFAAGVTGISITAVLFSQIDKIVLSKTLNLDDFGYYSISATLGLLIYQIIGPVSQSYFPKFSGLTDISLEEQLKNNYHQASQIISILVFPATFILVFFSRELVWIWTQNEVTVDRTSLIVSIFALGTGVNGLLNIPYQLTLANGWTKLFLYQNILLLILMTPLTIVLSLKYGAIGGASSWLIVNLLCFLITPHLIHKFFLKGEISTWYFSDTIIPLICAILTVCIFKYLIYSPGISNHRWMSLTYLIFVGIFTVIITLLSVKNLRLMIYRFF
ncbi:lipopolysaccharide biosynthesis protein [Aquirufa ecclesiirivi]